MNVQRLNQTGLEFILEIFLDEFLILFYIFFCEFMQMISDYEVIKMNLTKNDPKEFEDITEHFKSCKSIEVQKKILVLLLRNVKKSALCKYKVLGEYNALLIKINVKQMKEGVYDLLYRIHCKVEDITDTKLLRENIQTSTWNNIKFEDKEIKVSNGYVFIDKNNVAFYSSTKNFVINYGSIEKYSVKESVVTLYLKSNRKFIFNLSGDRNSFIRRLDCEFKMLVIKDKITDVYKSPNTSTVTKNEDTSCLITKKDTENPTQVSFRRSSLSQNKLVFRSNNTQSFGNNLKIKVTKPKKELFNEKSFDNEEKSLIPIKKSLVAENNPINDIKSQLKKSFKVNNDEQNTEKKQEINKNKANDKLRLEKDKENDKLRLGNDKENDKLRLGNDKKNDKLRSKINNIKINIKKTMKKNKMKIIKKINKFVKDLTKKRMKNVNTLLKLQVKNIKQRGRALKIILSLFIKKYIGTIKHY